MLLPSLREELKQKLSGKAGRLTKSRAQPAPSFVAYCPSACSCGDSGLGPYFQKQQSGVLFGLGGVGSGIVRDCALLGFQDGKEGSVALQSLQEGDHKASTVEFVPQTVKIQIMVFS